MFSSIKLKAYSLKTKHDNYNIFSLREPIPKKLVAYEKELAERVFDPTTSERKNSVDCIEEVKEKIQECIRLQTEIAFFFEREITKQVT